MYMNKIIETENINNENINNENNRKEIIRKLYIEMIKLYQGDAKRIHHFTKVNAYGKLIAELEQVSPETYFIIDAATLTHDIGRKIWKLQWKTSGAGRSGIGKRTAW